MKNIEKYQKLNEKERVRLKVLESESIPMMVLRANSKKSEEKLEIKDQFF